jgi:hypothetical protein
MWEPQPLATLRAPTACTGITLPIYVHVQSFLPHNGRTVGNVLILIFSPMNDSFNSFVELLLMHCYHTDVLFLMLFVSYLYVLLHTSADFVIGPCAAKFAHT